MNDWVKLICFNFELSFKDLDVRQEDDDHFRIFS